MLYSYMNSFIITQNLVLMLWILYMRTIHEHYTIGTMAFDNIQNN